MRISELGIAITLYDRSSVFSSVTASVEEPDTRAEAVTITTRVWRNRVRNPTTTFPNIKLYNLLLKPVTSLHRNPPALNRKTLRDPQSLFKLPRIRTIQHPRITNKLLIAQRAQKLVVRNSPNSRNKPHQQLAHADTQDVRGAGQIPQVLCCEDDVVKASADIVLRAAVAFEPGLCGCE